MPPCIEQRLLGGVFYEGGVTQDPASHRVQRVTDASNDLVERLFVAAHRQLDELSHISPTSVLAPGPVANQRA